MTIAIPVFQSWVSPNFSTAPELLVVQSDGRTVWSKVRVSMAKSSLVERRKRLLALGVDTLICGGMDRVTQDWFERRKVRLITNVVGDAQDVLSGIMNLRDRQVARRPGEKGVCRNTAGRPQCSGARAQIVSFEWLDRPAGRAIGTAGSRNR
jgi:predicted Fe-Mo cluster-binding NifX family protein